MARCQVSWSTPGGGPAAGPGAVGTPCSLKQSRQTRRGRSGRPEVDDCSGGGVFDEQAARSPAAANRRGQRYRPH